MKKVFYVQRLKKFYSEFSQVLERYSVDSGEVYSISDSGNNKDLERELTNFVLKYFGVNPQYKTRNSLYFKYLNGNSLCTLACLTYDSKNVIFVTHDGYTVELGADGHVPVDVNDNNNKNILGRDLFLFEIKNGRLNPQYGDSKAPSHIYWRTNEIFCGVDSKPLPSNADGRGCAARIMESNWEMKY